jgi:hypothetical protein
MRDPGGRVSLYLIRLSVARGGLETLARARGYPLSDIGYLMHVLLAEAFDVPPQTFHLTRVGPTVEAEMYQPAEWLGWRNLHASAEVRAATSTLKIECVGLGELVHDLRTPIAVVALPVVRLSKPLGGYAAGAEVDVVTQAQLHGRTLTPAEALDARVAWVMQRLESAGAPLVLVDHARSWDVTLVRQTQRGPARGRRALSWSTTAVEVTGYAQWSTYEQRQTAMLRGIGRHRGFGFGMVRVHETAAHAAQEKTA